MRFALIDAEKAEFPVRTMCRVLDVSESGFFSWKGRPASQRQRDDMIYLAHIRIAFELSNRTYGSPRMHRDLVDEGLSIGRRRTARLMRENGLAARQKRRFKRTTDSTHAWPVAPNLLDQDFAAEAPDQKWSADISYIWTAEGWLYLAVLIDLFSRRVVGWAVSDRLKKDLALRALRMALVTRHPPSGLIHHSDRGSQGEFNRSSQHSGIGGCYDGTQTAGQSLRQRDDGELHEDAEGRGRLSHGLRDRRRCRAAPAALHRQLQREAPTLGAWLLEPQPLRGATAPQAGQIGRLKLSDPRGPLQATAGRRPASAS